MGTSRDPDPSAARTRPRHSASGQSVVEFAIVVPVIMLLLVGIADFGRLYTSAVAVEAATREAADFGAFQASNWSAANASTTVSLMEQRACVAAAGSHLEGYRSSDPSNNTCSNPSFTCTLEHAGSSIDCASSSGSVNGFDCSAPVAPGDTPCTVWVRLDYDFTTILGIPPLPSTIHLTRDSRFRVSDLTPP